MERRVERIAGEALGQRRRRAPTALDLGRHLPRHRRAAAARACAASIGLDPAFTIHDREDSADLMNLVRHELGLSTTREPLSAQGHLPGDLFARGQRAGAARPRCCGRHFPWCAGWAERADAACSPPTSRPSRRRTCSTTTTCCSTGPQMAAEPALAAEHRRALRPRAGRRVPGHQPPAGRDPPGAEARRPRRSRWSATTRSRSIPSAPPTVRNILDFPGQFTPPAEIVTLERNYRSTAADPGGLQRGDRRWPRERFTKNLWTRPALGRAAARWSASRDEADQARYVADAGAGRARGRHGAESSRRCCSAPRTTAARSRSS